MRAFWFEPASGALQFNDGRKPLAGETHKVDGKIVMCEFGLHASKRAIDALEYAESNVVWLVELSGEILEGNDKCCATERKYIKRLDAEKILFECSCQFALSVAHLWDMPPIVRQFLETGDQSIRDAAWDAARAAAWASARDAASTAAWAAERAAAWAAARAAAWAAARAAAMDAASTTAWAAAWAAAWTEQNNLLQSLILKAMGEEI